MSSFLNRAVGATILIGLGVGVAVAAPPFKPAPIPANYLSTWKAEATDFGKHPMKKPAHPPGFYKIGTTPTPAQVTGWTITVYPNGVGLPPGQGTVSQGEKLYGQDCAMCHGTFAEGKNGYPQLVGGVGSLKTATQTKTLGSYWPFSNTVWDYINRAMPFYAPHTLKPDQVYALTAYLLNMNGIVHSNFVANAQSVADVKMPDRKGWNWKDPRPVTHNVACMNNCVKSGTPKITSNAVTMNLTPHLTGPVDHMKNGK
jgi:cytochrome c